MPRKPVDRVEEMRVTFGQKERDLIEGALESYKFNQVATPIVAAISDVSFWITLSSLLAILGVSISPPADDDVRSWSDAVRLGITDWRAARETEGIGDDLAVLWRMFTPLGIVYTAGGVNQ